MATLTETAYYSRKIVRWGIIALIGFIILRILFNLALVAIRRAFPAPPLRPNYLFGKLPTPSFPQSASPSGELAFTLQTISGGLPQASDAAKVYFMPKNRINLLSLSKTQSFVSRLGFTTSPRQVNDTKYRWIDLRSPLKSIEMDIVSNQFTLSYAFVHDLSLFSERNVPPPDEAITEAYSYLQNLSLDIGDIYFTNANTTYLKLTGDQLEPTTSQSQADAVRVDFFRSPLNGLPMLTDEVGKGNVSVTLSGSRQSDQRILSVQFTYWPVDTSAVAVYKLRSITQAYEDLKAGKAYLVSLPTNTTQITITNVYLGYYDGKPSQLYLQPVFVFEGENKFQAYVPAIISTWLQ